MTGVLIRRGEDTHTYTQGRRPCAHGGRGWSDIATSQGMPGASRSWRRQGRLLP